MTVLALTVHVWKFVIRATPLRRDSWLLLCGGVVGIFHGTSASLWAQLGFWIVRFHVPSMFGLEGTAFRLEFPYGVGAVPK